MTFNVLIVNLIGQSRKNHSEVTKERSIIIGNEKDKQRDIIMTKDQIRKKTRVDNKLAESERSNHADLSGVTHRKCKGCGKRIPDLSCEDYCEEDCWWMVL